MHFVASSLAASFAFAAYATASPLEARADLKDWKVTSVNVFTPSGRPVRNDHLS